MNSWLPSIRWPGLERDGARDRHRLGQPEHRQRQRRSARARATSCRSKDRAAKAAGAPDGSAPTVGTMREPASASSYGEQRCRATIPTIMYGTRGSNCLAASAATQRRRRRRRAIPGSTSRRRARRSRASAARNSRCRGIGTPKKLRELRDDDQQAGARGEADDRRWCEMKLTSAPRRASPSAELHQPDHQRPASARARM